MIFIMQNKNCTGSNPVGRTTRQKAGSSIVLPAFSFFQNPCPHSSKSKLNNYIKKEPEAKLCLRFFSLVQNCNLYPGDLKFLLSPRPKPQLFAGSNNINHHLLLSGKKPQTLLKSAAWPAEQKRALSYLITPY